MPGCTAEDPINLTFDYANRVIVQLVHGRELEFEVDAALISESAAERLAKSISPDGLVVGCEVTVRVLLDAENPKNIRVEFEDGELIGLVEPLSHKKAALLIKKATAVLREVYEVLQKEQLTFEMVARVTGSRHDNTADIWQVEVGSKDPAEIGFPD